MFIILKSNINTDTSIFVFSREKSHDSKYSKAHSPPNFIFWLGRLVFSVSINSHPDNIYISQQPLHIGTPLQFVVDISYKG
jgi:hypothetical protein